MAGRAKLAADMNREPEAQRLRAEGATYRQIADGFGVSLATAFRWVAPGAAAKDRARSRDWKRRHREERRAYDARYALEHRHACPECGHMLAQDSTGEQCPGCIDRRRLQIVEWWQAGLTARQIGERLGWSKVQAGVEIVRMREQGYDMPHRRSPEQVERIRDGWRRVRSS